MNLVGPASKVVGCKGSRLNVAIWFSQVIVNEETSEATSEFLNKRLFAIKNQRNAGDTEELALVIGEQSLSHMIRHNVVS